MKLLDADKLRMTVARTLEEDIESGKVGCAALRVTQCGQVLLDERFGANDGVPLARDAIFRLASMSKPITAVAVQLLAMRGLLAVDDRVSKYYPSYAKMNVGMIDSEGRLLVKCPSTTEVTLFHLLTHTSGILTDAVGARCEAEMPMEYRLNLQAAAEYIGCETLLAFSPFERSLYSPVGGFTVLSAIVEKVSDMEFGEFLRKYLFEPLEMPDTCFEPSQQQWERLIPVHARSQEGKSYVVPKNTSCTFDGIPLSLHTGAASLVSTVNDYSNFAKMLLGDGLFNGRRIIDETYIKQMRSPLLPEDMPGVSPSETWGLGVRSIRYATALPAGVFGWSGAYGTHFWVDPENNITAIYLKNSYYDGGAGAYTSGKFERDVYL